MRWVIVSTGGPTSQIELLSVRTYEAGARAPTAPEEEVALGVAEAVFAGVLDAALAAAAVEEAAAATDSAAKAEVKAGAPNRLVQ